MNVDGYTSKKIQEIANETTIDAFVNVDGNLILKTADGTQNNVGPLTDNLREIRSSIVSIGSYDTGVEDILINDWTDGVPNANLPLLSGQNPGTNFAWSGDGRYLAITVSQAPYLQVYKRTEDTFVDLGLSVGLPTSFAVSVAWSPDSQFLVVGVQSSPYMYIYKRTGDAFAAVTNPATMPTTMVTALSFSPDGRYLAVGTNFVSGLDELILYTYENGTFVKTTNPLGLPDDMIVELSWSPSGRHLLLGYNSFPYIAMCRRDGSIFTRLSNPIEPSYYFADSAWSPDGKYLILYGSAIAPEVYSRVGDVFTKLTDPSVPTHQGNCVDYSPDGEYILMTKSASPRLSIYRQKENTFSPVISPQLEPGDHGFQARWSPDGRYLAFLENSSENVLIYKSREGLITDIAGPVQIQP